MWETSTEKDSRDQNDEFRKPVETNVDEDRNTADETENGRGEEEAEEKPVSETSSSTSVFQNLNIFRDFFLAAFSDGYNSNFCGVEDVGNCCKGSKVAPSDSNSIKLSRSTGASFDTSSVQHTASQQDAMKRRRKKPLAVAVGFNYTKDANGRPIIITPTGSRNSPIDLTHIRTSPARGGGGSTAAPAPSLPTLNTQSTGGGSFTPGVPALLPAQNRYNSQPNFMPF